jgi:prepilin-type processing-associated H-X9-DG protein
MKAACHPDRRQKRQGFTLVELLAIIAILAALLLPTLAAAEAKTKTVVCLNHLRQLHLGWFMYAEDNNDTLPLNSIEMMGGKAPGRPQWAAGIISFDDGAWESDNLRDNTNTWNLLSSWGGIGPYVKAAEVFRCPADLSYVELAGKRYSRVRSYAMNQHMGNWPTYVDGVEHGGLAYPFWWYHKLSSIKAPPPSDAFVFIDTSEDSIDSRAFMIDLRGVGANGVWEHIPTARHGRVGTLSFADGHIEKKRWLDPRTVMPSTRHWVQGIWQANNPDIDWLAVRATADFRH